MYEIKHAVNKFYKSLNQVTTKTSDPNQYIVGNLLCL